MDKKPNRYGAKGITNADGEPCCCHGRSLEDTCDGCVALEATDRQPTLVGVDPARMNEANADEEELFAEDGDDLDLYPEDSAE